MPGIFKKLNAQDIKITPFEAHKQYTTTALSSIGASSDFISWVPHNKFYYKEGNIKYYQIDKLYYRNYIDERAHRLELDDATYTTQERRLYEYANVISLPQKTFGSEVQPGTFQFSCSFSSSGEQFNIADDGFGNLYDVNKGKDDFPNEDNRVFYLSPVQSFKRKDLTVNYNNGEKYINPIFPEGFQGTFFDDSYFKNKLTFKNIKFTTASSGVFHSESITTEGLVGFNTFQPSPSFETTSAPFIKIFNEPHLNFDRNESFTISFYYEVTEQDWANSSLSQDYFIVSKEGTKTVPTVPSETNIYTPLSSSNQMTTAPVGDQFPYRVFYRGNHPAANTASIFFERSDGGVLQSVSASFFVSESTRTLRHVTIDVFGESESVTINVEGFDSTTNFSRGKSATQLSNTLNKSTRNQADIHLFAKFNPDGTLSNNLWSRGGSGVGKISQFMIWNKALSSTERANVSESIVGTPNIGNIFYDNGFGVITHPAYEDCLRNYDIKKASIIGSGLALENTSPAGLAFNNDGSKLFIADATDVIDVYTLSTKFDSSTATFTKSVPLANIENNAIDLVSGIKFSPDGNKMFLSNRTSGDTNIIQFKLSSSFDPGSATFVQELTTVGTQISDLEFSNDGKKLFAISNVEPKIEQYDLINPYDLTAANHNSFLSHSFAVNSLGMKFSRDGRKLFTVSTNLDQVIYFRLKEPFEISSAVHIGSLHISEDTNLTGIDFNLDGTKMFFVGTQNDKIYQYNLPNDIHEFKYKNTHLITENEYQCTVNENEFEFTTNISARKIPFSQNEDIANFATGSNFKPYITTIGLHDENGNLLVVGKLAQPVRASSETDTTFVLRFDT